MCNNDFHHKLIILAFILYTFDPFPNLEPGSNFSRSLLIRSCSWNKFRTLVQGPRCPGNTKLGTEDQTLDQPPTGPSRPGSAPCGLRQTNSVLAACAQTALRRATPILSRSTSFDASGFGPRFASLRSVLHEIPLFCLTYLFRPPGPPGGAEHIYETKYFFVWFSLWFKHQR